MIKTATIKGKKKEKRIITLNRDNNIEACEDKIIRQKGV